MYCESKDGVLKGCLHASYVYQQKMIQSEKQDVCVPSLSAF